VTVQKPRSEGKKKTVKINSGRARSKRNTAKFTDERSGKREEKAIRNGISPGVFLRKGKSRRILRARPPQPVKDKKKKEGDIQA